MQEEVGVSVQSVAKYPSYFFTFHDRKGYRSANLVYETVILEEELQHFQPSDECVEYGFFTKEEAEKMQIYPNVQEFLNHFNPDNH